MCVWALIPVGVAADSFVTHNIRTKTHISIDKHVKPYGVGLDQRPVIRPVLHFIVFGKSVRGNYIGYNRCGQGINLNKVIGL